jgi:carbon storage regulator
MRSQTVFGDKFSSGAGGSHWSLKTAAHGAWVARREGVGPMLVLSRQRDESIIIGENIVITVVDIRGDKVRLGIQAPTEIPVHRQEVYEAIQREQAKTQGTDTTTVDVALAKFPNRRPGKPAQ